jgi:NADH dehydrogenase (ubiquinone) 1 beta subcomplex subunit 10
MVDNEIVNILRQRFEDCVHYEQPDHAVKCKDILEQYNKAAENWFIKCKWAIGFKNYLPNPFFSSCRR